MTTKGRNFELAAMSDLDICRDVADRVDQARVKKAVQRASLHVDLQPGYCVICGKSPSDMWPPFGLWNGELGVCLRCAELHGT